MNILTTKEGWNLNDVFSSSSLSPLVYQCNLQVSVSWFWLGLPLGLTSAGINISCIVNFQHHHYWFWKFDKIHHLPFIIPHHHLPFTITIIISHPLRGLCLWYTLDDLRQMQIIVTPLKEKFHCFPWSGLCRGVAGREGLHDTSASGDGTTTASSSLPSPWFLFE